ncbi:MAG: retron system putative HNH endonuclease [Gammaproteobacteria bacterium]|nr:retron system putative HNH endonuclease [Gammaproteobacteria bacterium]
MKWVQKCSEPQIFTDWKALASEAWQPSYANLGGAEKQAVKQALMQEQGGLCCYCERRLSEADSHIEHFRPQSDLGVDALEFANMLCSCQNQLRQGEPRHCGNAKGDWFDEAVLVSPLESDCESRFSYLGNGCIKPSVSNDNFASETIHHLALDIPKLRALRAAVITPFLDEYLTDEELKRFAEGYLQQQNDGLYGEFWSVIKYLFLDCVGE